MVEPSSPVEAPEPRYERFTVTYPSGTVLDSAWCLEGGATLREVAVAHPMAVVEPIEDSLVSTASDARKYFWRAFGIKRPVC